MFWCVRRGSNPDRRRRRPLWYPIPPRAHCLFIDYFGLARLPGRRAQIFYDRGRLLLRPANSIITNKFEKRKRFRPSAANFSQKPASHAPKPSPPPQKIYPQLCTRQSGGPHFLYRKRQNNLHFRRVSHKIALLFTNCIHFYRNLHNFIHKFRALVETPPAPFPPYARPSPQERSASASAFPWRYEQ